MGWDINWRWMEDTYHVRFAFLLNAIIHTSSCETRALACAVVIPAVLLDLPSASVPVRPCSIPYSRTDRRVNLVSAVST